MSNPGAPPTAAPAPPPPASLLSATARHRGDTVFRWLSSAAGILTLVILVAIAMFLVVEAVPSLQKNTGNFFTTQIWDPDGSPVIFGVAALAFGTVLTSVLALAMAVPVAVGIALYITHYAPRRQAAFLQYLTDLLAAVPSVIFGLWGLYFVLPHLVGLQDWLSTYLGWIPLFADPNGQAQQFSKSIFGASVILALMVLPIISAISREVLRQVDPAVREAAWALGATRWEMIRTAVLPQSRPGLVSAVMLGLGRALGETIAVALVIGSTFTINWQILVPGGNTIAANIATKFGEAGSTGRSALVASGLLLFAITLIVNFAARAVLARNAKRAGRA